MVIWQTAFAVIFLPYGKSDMKTCGFRDILFAPNCLQDTITRRQANRVEAHFLAECASRVSFLLRDDVGVVPYGFNTTLLLHRRGAVSAPAGRETRPLRHTTQTTDYANSGSVTAKKQAVTSSGERAHSSPSHHRTVCTKAAAMCWTR